MTGLRVFTAEALRALRSQVLACVLALSAIAGMCAWMVTTAGREAGARAAVLATIDLEGTRTITIRAERGSTLLTPSLVEVLSGLSDVETALGFTELTAVDSEFAPRAEAVGYRTMVIAPWPADRNVTAAGELEASGQGLAVLGLADGAGAVVSSDGVERLVRGPAEPPSAASFLEPLVYRAESPSMAGSEGLTLATVVVIARTPDAVAYLTDYAIGLIKPGDPSQLTVRSSAELAAVRQAISGSLDAASRVALAASLAGSMVMVFVTFLALTMIRRRDFGRRRALGASRGFIIGHLELQALILGGVGGAVGAGVGVAVLDVKGAPLPSFQYLVAVVVMASIAALFGGLLPAVLAANRDPLSELRTP